MSNEIPRLALGGLNGVVGLIGMIRLAHGAFTGPLSTTAWVVVLLAMLPWVGYCAWRAGHGLSGRAVLAVAALCVVGLVTVWMFTFGAVVALLCSLAGFAIIWADNWPPRRSAADHRFVRVEELTTDDND